MTDSTDADNQGAGYPAEPLKDWLGEREGRGYRREQDRETLRWLASLVSGDARELIIAEDQMVARVPRLVEASSPEAVAELLERHNIRYGIDWEAIHQAVRQARQGQVQYNLVVARGRAPRIIEPARLEYRIGLEAGARRFEYLQSLFEAPHLEVLRRWSEPVPTVGKGQVLAEVVPAWIEAGRNVHGEEIHSAAPEEVELRLGMNVSPSADGRRCIAEVYGYAGLLDGEITVLSPLWISPDRTEVRFVHLPPAQPPPAPPTPGDLARLLELYWIGYGVMEEPIRQVCAAIQSDPQRPFARTIAQGMKAIDGRDAQIHYTFDAKGLLTWDQMHHFLRSPDAEALTAVLRELAGDQSLVFCMARRGEVLAEKVEATSGAPGRSVEGDEIAPERGADVLLEAGEFVDLSEDGRRCTAAGWGYACLRLDQVNVVPPIWVDPRGSAAYFLNLPQGENPVWPRVEDMQELVELFGIKHGFSPEQWSETLARLEKQQVREVLVPVAQARPPGPSQDARFEWRVDMEGNRVGKVLEDGSIDFRERRLRPVVGEGDLIGVLSPAVRGRPGRDVLGREVLAPQPLGIEVVTDALIRAQEEDGQIAFYAQSSGGVHSETDVKQTHQRVRRRIKIGISKISTIDGDVGYATGNIDFKGDVVISGSVQSLFSVRAEGAVQIGGYVEAGAAIQAGGDVAVKGGILGASTEVAAGGSIMARFVQEATLWAGGDVQVGAYIFNASVRARGRVRVLGRSEGRSRSLVGGLVWGGKGIEALSIGSPYSSGTRLVAGVDPELVKRLEELRARRRIYEARRQELRERLGLEQVDVELVRQKLLRLSSHALRRRLMIGVKQAVRLDELYEALQREMEEIAQQQRELALRAEIAVLGRLFPGVEVRIGEQTRVFMEEQSRARLRLVVEDEDEEARIEVGVLRGG